MNLPPLSNKYWIIIGLITIFHTIAAILTVYFITTDFPGKEANPLMSYMFSKFGVIPIVVVAEIFMVWFLFWACSRLQEHENKNILSSIITVLLVICVIITALDAVNDLFVYMHSPLAGYTLELVKFVASPIWG